MRMAVSLVDYHASVKLYVVELSAGRYTSICSYSRYVSNTGYHGYHSNYTGVFFITFL